MTGCLEARRAHCAALGVDSLAGQSYREELLLSTGALEAAMPTLFAYGEVVVRLAGCEMWFLR